VLYGADVALGSLGSVALSLDIGADGIQQNAVALMRQIHKIRFIHKLWDLIDFLPLLLFRPHPCE
jgi:hypothetical protein